jgi:hypothetical protein
MTDEEAKMPDASTTAQEDMGPSKKSFFDYIVLSAHGKQASPNQQPSAEILEHLSIPLVNPKLMY